MERDGDAVVPVKVCGKKALSSVNVFFAGVTVFVDLGFRDSQCFFIVIHVTIIVTVANKHGGYLVLGITKSDFCIC